MQVVINRCYGEFEISPEAERILLETLGEDAFYEMERHDPIFVSLVEKMGERANGSFAKLAVEEIADGLDYDIDEYDGFESITEYISVTEKELREGLSVSKLELLKYTNIIRVKYDHLDSISREQSLNKNVQEVEEDNSPRVIGKIELPEGNIISDNEYDCELCGCETGSSGCGDTRHILNVRDEVYGTWRQEKICDNCYYAQDYEEFDKWCELYEANSRDGVNSYRVVKPYMEDDSFKGYWYTDKNGNASHSWDYEQSIGE